MGKPIHSQAEAELALAEIGPVIAGCIYAGWEDYLREYTPQVRLRHSKATRAAIVCDHIRGRLRDELAAEPDVRLVNYRGQPLVIVEEKFAIKIPKRLSSRRLSRTYPTQQTLGFLNQENQGKFEFLVDRTGLVIGYELDGPELAIKQVHVTCPDGPKRNNWAFPIVASAPATNVATLPLEGLPASAIIDPAQEKKTDESTK